MVWFDLNRTELFYFKNKYKIFSVRADLKQFDSPLTSIFDLVY